MNDMRAIKRRSAGAGVNLHPPRQTGATKGVGTPPLGARRYASAFVRRGTIGMKPLAETGPGECRWLFETPKGALCCARATADGGAWCKHHKIVAEAGE